MIPFNSCFHRPTIAIMHMVVSSEELNFKQFFIVVCDGLQDCTSVNPDYNFREGCGVDE